MWSRNILWKIIPLIIIPILFCFFNPRASNWGFVSPVSSPFVSENLENINKSGFVLPIEEIGGKLKLKSKFESSYVLSPSVSPPMSVEAIHASPQLQKQKIDQNLNVSVAGAASQTNKSSSFSIKTSIIRKSSKLMKIETHLGQVRAQIRQAKNKTNQIQDPDFVPGGPMYWNAISFYRSYLEMEKQLKVYVYEEGEPPVFHNGPCRSIYAIEGNFINAMEISRFRTRDPEKAHVFFMPFSITSMVRFVYVHESHDWSPMRQTVRDYINLIEHKYPYWNRSIGADHFMLACHDWGPELSSSVPYLYKNSIRALCNANTSEGFNPAKDVSIPEILLRDGTTSSLLGGPSPSKRPILAFFAGGLHGPIRPILLDHWENKDKDIQVHKYLPKGVSYNAMVRKSKFCLCPSGYEVASPRMVEALYMGCVPVLIKDYYVSPFSDVLNWKSFSVEVAVKDIPNLKTVLTGISSRQYIRLQRRGLRVRRHFEVNFPPKRFDVFHMILHSIWLRRLNVRVRDLGES